MKKSMFIPAAILLVAACNQTQIETIGNHEGLVPFTINDAAFPVATPEDEGSKTALADLSGSAVNWTAGDNAIVFDNGGAAGHLFTGSVLSDATRISLTGEVNDKATAYWALYPYNSGAALSGGVLSTTLSASQSAVAGSFADKTAISLAKGTRTPGQESANGLEFENLCTLISFNMPSYVEGAQSVTITANSGTDLAGSISFNAADGSLNSVSGSTSVTLNGPLAAGAKYFAVIAPKEYAGGFTFTVTAAGGATYSASSSKTVPGAQGAIYHIGTLGLKLDVTPTVTFNHTYSGNVLTGTTATLNIPVASDLAAMIDHWTVTLKNKDSGDIVRNYTTNSGTGSPANEYAYLPMGKYTLAASYTTLDGRSKSLPTIEVTNDKEPVFSVNVTGKTSYDYYTSDGASSANSKDGSTIYELGTSVTISTDLLNNTNYNKTYTYSYDGGSAVSISGNSVSIANKTGQSWNKHTLSASCTFDGVTQKDSCDLHVTGLPYGTSTNTSYNLSGWTYNSSKGSCEHGEKNGYYYFCRDKSGTSSLSKSFYAPGTINLKVYYKIQIDRRWGTGPVMSYIDVGGNNISSMRSEYKLSSGETLTDEASKDTSISSANTEAIGKMTVNASTVASEVRLYYMNLLYR